MRTKKMLMNSISTLMLQLVTVICGFILPRVMLTAFGSEINGAVSSITQFLGYISLLEAGVGGVTRAALYKPLANADSVKISRIVNATQSFFRKVAGVFILYAVVLSVVFKYISSTELEWGFTIALVAILAVSTFAQYYFGITYSVVLQADQRNYISTSIRICTLILNTVFSVILINLGCSVIVVKLVTTGIYIIQPLLLNIIAKKQYKIDKSVTPDNEAIKQRWNGFGHHIAFYLHNSVDNMVVTIVLGLKWASVYSVYYMITSGVKNIINALTGSSEAAFGNMMAKNEQSVLQSRFRMVETLTSMVVVTFFTATGLLLLDFIRIYTDGIDDINYIIPAAAVLFPISEAIHCIKQNYHNLVLAAGHYKETQKGAFIEAGLNLVLSILFAFCIGLPGVLVATIISTIYRVIDYVFHLKKNIICRDISVFIKRQTINTLNAVSIVAVCTCIPFFTPTTYLQWGIKACVIFFISLLITMIWNCSFYRAEVKKICSQLLGVIHR